MVVKKLGSVLHSKKEVIISFCAIITAAVIISLTVGKSILEGTEPTLTSFAIVNFMGYLFIFMLPVETLVPYYIVAGHNGAVILIIALITAMIGQSISYAVGNLFSASIIKTVIKEKRYERMKNYIDKYGSWTILIFNLFPLASAVLSLVAGITQFKFKRFLLYSFIGLTIKYIFLIYLSDWITPWLISLF